MVQFTYDSTHLRKGAYALETVCPVRREGLTAGSRVCGSPEKGRRAASMAQPSRERSTIPFSSTHFKGRVSRLLKIPSCEDRGRLEIEFDAGLDGQAAFFSR